MVIYAEILSTNYFNDQMFVTLDTDIFIGSENIRSNREGAIWTLMKLVKLYSRILHKQPQQPNNKATNIAIKILIFIEFLKAFKFFSKKILCLTRSNILKKKKWRTCRQNVFLLSFQLNFDRANRKISIL